MAGQPHRLSRGRHVVEYVLTWPGPGQRAEVGKPQHRGEPAAGSRTRTATAIRGLCLQSRTSDTTEAVMSAPILAGWMWCTRTASAGCMPAVVLSWDAGLRGA